MAIKTSSTTSNGSFSSLSISGTTSKSGNMSWSSPTLPDGATITGTTLTANLTVSMTRGSATVTINGNEYYNSSSLSYDLGTTLKTSLSVTASGANKNSTGTVSISDIVYTVNYQYDDGTGTVNTYTVRFLDYDGNVLDTQEVEHGKNATPPGNPSRNGYKFTGWKGSYNNITADTDIVATYAEESTESAPVTSKQGVFTPSMVDLAISKYKDESSPFSNAYGKDKDNTGSYAEWGLVTGSQANTHVCWGFDLSSIPSNATITNVKCEARCSNTNASTWQGGNTLVAIGTTDGNAYVNKVASDNASFGTTATVVTVESADYTRAELDNFRLKVQAVRGFLGTSTSYHTKFYGATLTIDYEVPAEVTSHTVRFLDWNGNVLDTQTVEHGKDATPPSNPSRTGYDFTGWQGTYTNIQADTDITAQYKIKTFTVRFLDWNNSVLKTQTVNYGGNATPPNNPTRDGYDFTGWQGTYTNITANVDIIAQYEEIPKTRNLYVGGNTISNIYLGNEKITKVYLGNTLIYEG